jgi:hypothetical protein
VEERQARLVERRARGISSMRGRFDLYISVKSNNRCDSIIERVQIAIVETNVVRNDLSLSFRQCDEAGSSKPGVINIHCSSQVISDLVKRIRVITGHIDPELP